MNNQLNINDDNVNNDNCIYRGLPSKPRTPNSDNIELHATNSACISEG